MGKQSRKRFQLAKVGDCQAEVKQAEDTEGHMQVGRRTAELTSRLGTTLGADDSHPVTYKD